MRLTTHRTMKTNPKRPFFDFWWAKPTLRRDGFEFESLAVNMAFC
jgi:hypothetical protein